MCTEKPFTVKPVLSGHSNKHQKLVFKTYYHLLQVKSIAECSNRDHSAILSTFIKLPLIIKIFFLSIFEWPLKTGITVFYVYCSSLTVNEPRHEISNNVCANSKVSDQPEHTRSLIRAFANRLNFQ